MLQWGKCSGDLHSIKSHILCFEFFICVLLILLQKLDHSHTTVMLLASCQDPVVIKVSLGTMVGSLYKWGHTVMSLDGAEFLVEWFKAYNVEILR